MAIGPQPEFAWSVSRAKLFSFCPRKFYYRYHGMWGGWDDRADPKAKLCYLLSKRTSLAGWAGQEAHRAMALYLRSDIPMQQIIASTREHMRDQFRSSRSKAFMRPRQAKQFGLSEHYYADQVEDGVVRERWEQVEACLLAFERSSYRADLRAAEQAGRLTYVEDPDSTDFDQMGLTGHGLGDFRIYAQPDCVLTYEDGLTCIVDWKTGRPPEQGQDRVTDQLGLYALWVQEKLGLQIGSAKLEAYEVYWPDEQTRGDSIGPQGVQAALAFARDSVAEIRARIRDQSANAAEEADFEPKGTEAKCGLCDFRAVCPDKVIE